MSTREPGTPGDGALSTGRPGGSAVRGPLRILLVDDNEAGRRGLTRFLELEGYAVTAVDDGTSALEALEAGPPPDFVLTDLRLPDLDGREVARFARRLVPPPRVALITGWDIEPEQEDSASSGFEWIFPKPVDVRDLIAKLRKASDASSRAPGIP